MIELNVDFSLLYKYFGITTNSIFQYQSKDIEEIMKLEAQKGNEKAKDYKQILSDPNKLLEIFKLANVENKYIILQNMSEGDLDKLLPFLTQQQLALGLNFFTDEKIMSLVNHLPIEELVVLIFENFELKDVLDFMEDDAMDTFLKQPDVDRHYAQKYFESLDYQKLQNIMIQQFGSEYKDKSQKDYLKEIEQMQDSEFTRFITSFKREDKMALIQGVTAQDDDLLLLFEAGDLSKPMDLLQKEDKIKMMEKLDPKFLVPMIQDLPMDLTQIVLTQIDPEIFAKILAKDFQDILASVVLFSGSN